MVLSVSILSTILITNTYYACPPTVQTHTRPTIPDSLHRKDSPTMNSVSTQPEDTKDDKDPSALRKGRVTPAPGMDKDYKITIQISNNTGETDDFWNS